MNTISSQIECISSVPLIFRFDYFARTVPPDTFQSIALVDVVKSANWSYVSTVYSEGSYGEYGIEVFTREATERNVCIAAALKVPSAADDKVFDDIIQRLSKKPNARAVVLFTRAEDARGILEAARRSNLSQSFQVGGQDWKPGSNYCGALAGNMEPALHLFSLIID